MSKKIINVVGANEHNLQNISVQIPRDELTVITGLSGSGKSSLAFDTIYAEVKENMWKAYPLMPDNFLAKCKNPMLNILMVYLHPFQLSKELLALILAPCSHLN